MCKEQLKRKCPLELSTWLPRMEEIKNDFCLGFWLQDPSSNIKGTLSHPHFPFESLGDSICKTEDKHLTAQGFREVAPHLVKVGRIKAERWGAGDWARPSFYPLGFFFFFLVPGNLSSWPCKITSHSWPLVLWCAGTGQRFVMSLVLDKGEPGFLGQSKGGYLALVSCDCSPLGFLKLHKQNSKANKQVCFDRHWSLITWLHEP